MNLPKNIEKELLEKWFFLYNWITVKDVKTSIEKSFLETLNKVWKYIFILLFILWIIFTVTLYTVLMWKIILIILAIFLFIIILNFLYLFYVWIKNSYILSKNAYVIITNSSILLNWKIIKQNDNLDIEKELNLIEEIFWRKFIWEEKNINLIVSLKKEFEKWYKNIFSKKMWAYVIILLALYSLYVLFMIIIYFIWISVIWFLGLIISQINKFILKKIWHKVTVINSLFWKINIFSKDLENKKNEVKKYLNKAQNDNWEEGIILKINSLIWEINISANKTIDSSVLLKEEINSYKYKEIIDLQFLNNWIKKQIFEPLFEINELLSKNLEILILSEKEIKEQMLTSDSKFKNILELQLIRLKLQKEKISYNINVLEKYLKKVK